MLYDLDTELPQVRLGVDLGFRLRIITFDLKLDPLFLE
jgi:hypothetical protein